MQKRKIYNIKKKWKYSIFNLTFLYVYIYNMGRERNNRLSIQRFLIWLREMGYCEVFSLIFYMQECYWNVDAGDIAVVKNIHDVPMQHLCKPCHVLCFQFSFTFWQLKYLFFYSHYSLITINIMEYFVLKLTN